MLNVQLYTTIQISLKDQKLLINQSTIITVHGKHKTMVQKNHNAQEYAAISAYAEKLNAKNIIKNAYDNANKRQ